MRHPALRGTLLAILISGYGSAQTPPATSVSPSAKIAGQITSKQKAAAQAPKLVLTLAADKLQLSPNENAHFTSSWNRQVAGSIIYRFDWGDGQFNSSDQLQADHAYSTAGSYTVQVTASAAPSASRTSHSATISSNQLIVKVAQPVQSAGKRRPKLPSLTLSADPQNARQDVNVHFTASWSRPVSRVHYRFNWGDDHVADTDQPAADHAYSAPGSYTVQVAATPTNTSVAAAPPILSNALVVVVAPLQSVEKKPKRPLPILTLSSDEITSTPGQNVHVKVSSDQPIGDTPYRFYWGDGQISPRQPADAYHPYRAPGTYIIRATAEMTRDNRVIQIHSNDLRIEVAPPPTPAVQTVVYLQAKPRKGRAGEAVRFTAKLDPPSASAHFYSFDFGDGRQQDSTNGEILHIYRDEGEFWASVSASIAGEDRIATSRKLQLAIGPPAAPTPRASLTAPRINVAVLTDRLIVGREVTLQASLDPSGPLARYEFDWGDHSGLVTVASDGKATHRYAARGVYPVLVTAITQEKYPAQPEQRLTLVITRVWWQWPFSGIEWLIIVGSIAAIVAAAKAITRHKPPATEKPKLRFTAFPDAGLHQFRRLELSVPPIRLTLRPGMHEAEHHITVPRRAAASD